MRLFHHIASAIIFFPLTLVLATTLPAAVPEKTGRLNIVTTLFPLYDWAKTIGGDRVEVSLLLPPGVESHSFDPTPKDVARIQKSDLFVYTGKQMEPWVEDLLQGGLGERQIVVDSSILVGLAEPKKTSKKKAPRHHADEHGHDDHGKHDHRDAIDPHIWLDFPKAIQIVDGLARAMAAKDPTGANLYAERAREYKGQLMELDTRFAAALANCRHKTIVYGGHFAFGYLAKRYGLDHVSPYQGFSPNAEPRPKNIAELTTKMKKDGFRHIFYEEGIEPKVAKVISAETGATMLLLHGAHNVSKEELRQKVSYLSLMNDNLVRLQQRLVCQ
jgi:zinc transport system substrate-binding protein